MNPKEWNERYADKDRDGIPDRIDNSYSPPENELRYASVTPAFCDYLQKQDFSFSKCKMEGENTIISYKESEKNQFDTMKQAYSSKCRKERCRT